jgi:uncharacterized protein
MMRVFFFFLIAVSAAAQVAVPPHGGRWVHDDANALRPETRAQLEALLKAERDSTSNQIAIMLVSTLEGDDIDLYANRVFNEWKLGDEQKDNGVLFLIAINDRKMRIEVGQGLEGVLTDALSSRINRNEVAPAFRQGNYDAGVIAGTLAIIQAIQGEYKGTGPKKKSFPWIPFLLILAFIIISSRGRRGGGGGGYWTTGPMLGGFGGSSGSWGGSGGIDFGGGGFSGGGGSSDSW